MKTSITLPIAGRFLVIAGVIACMTGVSHSAFAGTAKVKGSYAETFITANFSYDGVAPATTSSHAGNDNIGGQFTGQMLCEFRANGGACRFADGDAGVLFD